LKLAPLQYQHEILSALQRDREKGKTLVVLPSGSGKTYVAAFDSKQCGAKSVLYIAHRLEILTQAQEIFKTIHGLDDSETGLLDQSNKQDDRNFIFASNQTLAKDKNLKKFAARVWDYVIIDEFHHIPASTYQKILDNIQYKFLLGITATPFRLDEHDIHQYVDNNLSYEIDLERGIKDKILVPFLYNGLYDNIDYSDIKWQGYKYRENDLNKKLLIDKRDNQILKEFKSFCGTRSTIGFCVSIKHCERITNTFNQSGIKSHYITHTTPMDVRRQIVEDFKEKRFQVLFVRDIYNEGVDFPFVEALMFLRPTWSKTVFFQQIGRGLRKAKGKEDVIILDFIGNYFNAFEIREWLGFADKSEYSLHHKPIKPEYHHAVASVYFDKKIIDIFEYQKARAMGATKEALTQEYFRMKKLLGRIPNSDDFTQKNKKFPHYFNATSFYWQFGKWAKVREAMGDDWMSIIKKTYFDLKHKLGRMPERGEFSQQVNHWKELLDYKFEYKDLLKSFGENIMIKCLNCGSVFERSDFSKYITGRYCSEACYRKDYYRHNNPSMHDIICNFCGKTKTISRKTHTIFCSDQCRKLAVKRNAKLYYQKRTPKFEEITCKNCGKKFTVEIKHKSIHCSNECKKAGRLTRYREKYPKFKEIVCKSCGKNATIERKTNAVCCSSDCQRLRRRTLAAELRRNRKANFSIK